MPSRGAQTLDPFQFVGFQAKVESLEIGPHVVGVGGAGQGRHADLKGEPENNLADGPAVAFGDPDQFGTGQRLAIGGEQREALVDQSVGGAELPDLKIPTPNGVASVLNDAGPDACLLPEALELFEGDVADPEQASPAAIADRFHRSPGLPVFRSQAYPLSGAVEQIGIDYLGAQMVERAGERLLDLGPDWRFRIVGQAVILRTPEGKLGL